MDGVEGGGGDEAAVDKVFDCGDRSVGGGAMEPRGGVGCGLLEEGFGTVEDRGCHGVRFLILVRFSSGQEGATTMDQESETESRSALKSLV